MVKLAMPTEDTHKDPCEQNLNLLQTMIANDYAALIEARSTQGEVDRIKSREMTLLEDKIMKLFAKQLVNKHELLRTREETYDSVADSYIKVDQFLTTVGLESRTVKILRDDLQLTLDGLFNLQLDAVNNVTSANEISATEHSKLVASLERLHKHYEQYEQNKKISSTSADFERFNSVSSDNSRCNSSGASHCVTPSRFHAIRPALPSQSSFSDKHSPPHTPSNLSGRPVLSSSSSSLMHNSVNLASPMVVDNSSSYVLGTAEPYVERRASSSRNMPRCDSVPVKHILPHPILGHTRSHSIGNPLGVDEGFVEEQYYQNPRSSSASPPPNESWNPDSSSVPKPHPQMRRVLASPPQTRLSVADGEHRAMSTSGSYDFLRAHAQPLSQSRPSSRDGMLTVHTPISTSHSHEDILREAGSDGYDSDYTTTRHYSTSLSPRADSRTTNISGPTSSSMVNLPNLVVNHDSYYGEDPDIGKASSVPRLTVYSTGGDSKESSGQHSMPTSPRTPGNYAPTGHIGHAIPHRFSNKTVLCTTRSCDYCKRSMVFGVRCQKCKYKCHKACARKAPFSCGLPPELEEYFRKRVLCSNPEPSSPSLPLPEVFPIQDLNKEPSQGRFSPLPPEKRRFEFARIPTFPESDSNPTATTLNVPNSSWGHPSGSTSPSLSSPMSSPSLTPRSPLSPQYPNEPPSFSESYDSSSNSSRKQSDSSQNRHTVDNTRTHNIYSYYNGTSTLYDPHSSRSQDEGSQPEDDQFNLDEEDLSSVSCDSIDDKFHQPRGRRPPPMIVSQEDLPDFVAALSPKNSLKRLLQRSLDMDERVSVTSTQITSIGSTLDDRNPLVGTNSSSATTSTLTSTLTTGSNDDELETEGEYDVELQTEEECLMDPMDGGLSKKIQNSKRYKTQRGSIFGEWEIPYEQLKFEGLIGKSDVCEVYKGKWHGKVTIKKFSLPNASKTQLNKFQLETCVLRQIRHENVALFMGACHTPPNLAIVTSFCNGSTLYQHLHIYGEKFLPAKCVNTARQVSQGMSYLHNKGIVHQNLSTRNIFLCKEVAIVCDVGLASLSEIMSSYETECGRREIKIQRGRLNYLAPEILDQLAPPCPHKRTAAIQYSTASDIYAFGTVMYEMLTGRWPYAGYAAETIIYMVGTGFRQTLDKIDCPKQLKALITDSWNHDPEERKVFKEVLRSLNQIYRKKTPVTRMTSTPIGLHGSSLEAPN